MRRLGIALLLVVLVLGGIWTLLLRLPNAPTHSVAIAVPAPAATSVPTVESATAVSALPPGALLGVPVAGVAREAITDNWGDPRENGLRAHHGTDIMAPGNTPVVAAAPGIVEKLFQSAKGGTTIYVRSPQRLWTYYYAHLASYVPGLHEGQVVHRGTPLGFVGDTGDAGPGNFHLHFGLTRTSPEQHWSEGRDVNPYPYLAGKPGRR